MVVLIHQESCASPGQHLLRLVSTSCKRHTQWDIAALCAPASLMSGLVDQSQAQDVVALAMCISHYSHRAVAKFRGLDLHVQEVRGTAAAVR